jgi:hypothetical protein
LTSHCAGLNPCVLLFYAPTSRCRFSPLPPQPSGARGPLPGGADADAPQTEPSKPKSPIPGGGDLAAAVARAAGEARWARVCQLGLSVGFVSWVGQLRLSVGCVRWVCRLGSLALSRCTAARPLHLGFAKIIGVSISETTVRPSPAMGRPCALHSDEARLIKQSTKLGTMRQYRLYVYCNWMLRSLTTLSSSQSERPEQLIYNWSGAQARPRSASPLAVHQATRASLPACPRAAAAPVRPWH